MKNGTDIENKNTLAIGKRESGPSPNLLFGSLTLEGLSLQFPYLSRSRKMERYWNRLDEKKESSDQVESCLAIKETHFLRYMDLKKIVPDRKTGKGKYIYPVSRILIVP